MRRLGEGETHMRNKAWILALFLCACVLVSCATPVADQKEPVDFKPSIQMLFDARPDNSQLRIKDVLTLEDIVDNSATYLKAWNLWESYALSLEDYLVKLESMTLFSL